MKWLSIQQVSILYKITSRAVREKLYNGEFGLENEGYKYVTGRGKGGKVLQIASNSLPQDIQDCYKNTEALRQCKPIMHYTGKQRQEADFKALVVVEYRRSGLSPDKFVSKFNTENPDDGITRHQLLRWQNKFKQGGDVADLIDRRGGHNRGKSAISDEAWDYFYCLYMTQQERSIQRCWEFTQREYPDIPSVSAFERRVKTIPEYAIIRYRKGEKAFNDSLPSMKRGRSDINSNDIWFSDHHRSDVFVINKKGKLVRLWITVFFDARSNMVVGLLARDASPNTTAIKQCFRKAAEKYCIPKEFYFDNGKDYVAKSFSQDFPLSIVRQLGIGNIYATPYHGQAKTVERFFGTLEERFGKLFPTYAGRDAKNRPECMRQKDEEILKFAPQMDDFIAALENYITEYNHTESNGIDMNGKCPEQVYYENLKEKNEVYDPDVLRYLCGTFEERTVRENGIQILNNYYFHELLAPYKDKKVIVSYYPENIDVINVFDMDNRAICVAYAKVTTPFRNTTEEDYKRAAKEKKAVRDFTKKHKPSRTLDIHNIIARDQLEEKNYSEAADPEVVTRINPQITKNQTILKSTEKEARRQRREEDDIAGTLLDLYERRKEG